MYANGSTREQRRIRAYVFARDRQADGYLYCHRCSVRLTEHDRTLPTHAHLGHLVDRVDAPELASRLDNLAPECSRCNTTAGGRTGARRRRAADLNASRDW